MKIQIISITFLGLFIINSTLSFAKKDTTVFYCNSRLEKVKPVYAGYYAKVYKKLDGTIGMNQYQKNGTIYMIGSFKKKNLKVRQGAFEYYNNDGLREKTGAFDDDLETGTWKYITAKGIVTGEGIYENGKRTGQWNFHTKEGIKSRTCEYKNGDYNGVFLEWKNETLMTEGQYVDDEQDGYWQAWYENGAKDYHGVYINGKRDGVGN